MEEPDYIAGYYAGRYTEPDRRVEFRASDGCAIDVLCWGPDKSGEDVSIYATIGAATWLTGPHTFCEFFIGLTREVEGVEGTLAEVGSEGIGDRGSPDPGDTITLADPIWAGTEMNTLLFTDGDELLPPTRFGGKTIRFLELVPLFARELEFKKRRGEEALWELFESQQIPYWDPLRPAARM